MLKGREKSHVLEIINEYVTVLTDCVTVQIVEKVYYNLFKLATFRPCVFIHFERVAFYLCIYTHPYRRDIIIKFQSDFISVLRIHIRF